VAIRGKIGIDAPVSWKKMLDAVPVRNEAAKFEELASGGTRATVARKKPAWLVPPVSWVIRIKPHKSVILDPIGMAVCGACDGKRTIESIVDEFAGRHRLSFHESRVAVTEYLGRLVRYGILAIRMDG
jgi:hypothetical protein